jgi:hypothetical protein
MFLAKTGTVSLTELYLTSPYKQMSVMLNVAIFLDIAPCGPNVKRRFGGTYYLHLQNPNSAEQRTNMQQVARKAKMQVIRSSETSIHIRTTRFYISEFGNIHTYRYENFRSYKSNMVLPRYYAILQKAEFVSLSNIFCNNVAFGPISLFIYIPISGFI